MVVGSAWRCPTGWLPTGISIEVSGVPDVSAAAGRAALSNTAHRAHYERLIHFVNDVFEYWCFGGWTTMSPSRVA
jgi:hypothetical protein